jgi:hypothetical protein
LHRHAQLAEMTFKEAEFLSDYYFTGDSNSYCANCIDIWAPDHTSDLKPGMSKIEHQRFRRRCRFRLAPMQRSHHACTG